MNEIWWLVMLIANFTMVTAAYRFFGKTGLFVWVPVSTILANIQVVQTVELFGMAATLGNIVYATSFLVTDILSEIYGKEEAKKAVWIGFFSLIAMTLIMNLALLFAPLADEFSQTTSQSLSHIFSLMPRIAAASLIAYLVSQQHDIWAYHFWRKRFPAQKHIWIRNNLSTVVSQLIDSVIFTLIAFLGVLEPSVLVEVVLSTYVLKFIVAAADTPFVYLAVRLSRRIDVSERAN
ncbi:MAG: queuosine precursor transporter [Bacteroidales bacterium]|nr:queuosine precursor transporter [Bacteroidales bacterium]MBN2749757.1 queuosine precursor transporter [Bacteroidales bacterium]